MNDTNITFLLTARGNNTLKDKNLRLINKKSCISYPALAAKKSSFPGEFFISSENEGILLEAERHGYNRILRPKSLSQATSLHEDVLGHALEVIKPKSDILVVLLGNAPVIKKEWIDESISLLLDSKFSNSVVPVFNDNDRHPIRSKTIEDNLLKPYFISENNSSNRQDLPASFFLCHNFWVIRLENGKLPSIGDSPWSFLGKKIMPFLLDLEIPIFDIHHEIDIPILEVILNKLEIV